MTGRACCGDPHFCYHDMPCGLRDDVEYGAKYPAQARSAQKSGVGGLVGGYPDDNPKTACGAQKTPMHLIPPPALTAEAHVFGLGAKKYGAYNWRQHTVSASVYQAAALRHLMAWWDGENLDPESGQSHLAHARACLGIVLDAAAYGKLNDDRPNTPSARPDC